MSDEADRRAHAGMAASAVYLFKNELLDLHTFVIERYGGRLGIASQDRLMLVLDAPRQVLFNAELYPDVPSKAAAQTFLLLKSRPFVNGNQATALLAMLRFLHLNNAAPRDDVDAAALFQVIHAIDQSAMTKEQFESWLRAHVSSMQP